jgi:uncharacterized protein involved in exopolysaccharide biosynthesis
MSPIEAGDTVSFRDICAIAFRRKWQLIVTFVLIVGASTIYTLLTPKQYESHMKILVKNQRADVIVSAGDGEGSGYRGEVSESDINSEIELLNSTNLLQRVVKDCHLARMQPGPAERVAVAIEVATSRLQHDLKITPVRKANIIQIDYSATDPHQATAVLRHVSEAYLEEHLNVHGTPGTYQFFASQAEHYQNELKSAEAKLEQYQQKHEIVMFAPQTDAMLQRASDSEAALMQADVAIGEYRRKIADTKIQLAAAPTRIVTQNRTAPNQYSVDHLGSMLVELQNRRTQLLSKFRSDDRLVQETEQEIAETQAAVEKATKVTSAEQSTDVNPVYQTLKIDMARQQAELAGAEARRQTLSQQVQSYRRQLMALADARVDYDDLERNQKKAEENYLLYAKKTEEARIAESLDRQKIANVAIVESPTEPHLPSKPNVKMNLTLGVLLAGLLSVALAIGSEYLQRPRQLVRFNPQPSIGARYLIDTVEHGSDLEALTGLPVLATVRTPLRD